MATGQLPLDGGKGSDRPPPTPSEQRQLLVNAGAAFNAGFKKDHTPTPQELRTAAEQVDDALASGAVRLRTQEQLLDQHDADEQDAAAAMARGDITQIISATTDGGALVVTVTDVPRPEGAEPAQLDDAVYAIPHQAQIECRALADGGIEIWQEGQHGADDEVTIHVAEGNVVMLARLLLLAAGFRNPGVISDTGRGCVDLIDGDTAANHNSEFPSRQ